MKHFTVDFTPKSHDIYHLVFALHMLRETRVHSNRAVNAWKAPPDVLRAARENIRQTRGRNRGSAPVAFFVIVAHWFGLAFVPQQIAEAIQSWGPN
jgi:hypothetical protein